MKKILVVVLVLGLAKLWFTDPSILAPNQDVRFSYLVEYSGNGSRGDALPMLVALHGNGDTAENFYKTTLDQLNAPARVILIQGPISYGSGNAWPWNANDFDQYGAAIAEAIDLLAVKYPTVGRPLLFGFSGGGMMAYYQAAEHGDRYSYIFPISGRLSHDLLGDKPPRVGAEVIAFHGIQDTVISISDGKQAVNLLKKIGAKVRFYEFKGGHQGIFSEMKSQITEEIEEKIRRLR